MALKETRRIERTQSMAVSSKTVLTSGVINTTYINVLQRLCTSTKATTQDISEIFKKLSRSLRSQTSTLSTSPSSHDPRSRRGDSEAAAMLQGVKGDRESFDRRCTWDPGEKQCWLVSDLEPWNRVLSRSCIELWEHSWGELTLAGFHWLDANPPKIGDVLQASLLMHLLLRQHRCVTRVLMNQSITCVEMDMFWHSLQNGGAGVLSFDFVALRSSGCAALQCFDVRVWSQSTVCLPALHSLHVSYALFDADVAHTLGDYLMRTTTLRSIALSNVQTDSEAASVFLDNLADNKTVTNLLLQKHFVMAREGDALAGVLRRHIALECLKIIGPGDHSPSAVLRAAVLSSSLKSLTVSCFKISAEDIDAMATALTRLPPSYASFTGAVAQPPLTQTSRLESLAFSGCPTAEPHLQRAYARLIGGVLRRLQISQCTLGHVFAIAAACQLRKDSRLHVLNVQFSQLPSLSICTLVRALKVNSTLQRMMFNLHGFLPELDLFTLFHTIREMDVSSRILFSWYEPRPLHVAQGGRLGTISTFAVDLDKLSAEEATTLLEPLAPGGHVTSAKIKSANPVEDAVVQQLADAFGKTKSVRHLILELNWPETSIVNILRTLEQNRSVCVLKIKHVIFTKRTSKALARVVEENRALNKIFVDLVQEAYDGSSQLRTLCRELKVAVPRNRFLTTVAVKFGGINCASDFVIKHALRRNRMLANQAVNFVKGSNDKKDALAFETLQHSWAVRSDLKAVGGEVSNDAPARKKINEARRRLAFNYFIFTGVVKTKIICYGRRRGKTSFDKLGRDVLVHVCSYLSLTDVMDI